MCAAADEEATTGRWWARLWRTLRGLGPAAPLFLLACVGPVVGIVVVGATRETWLPWFDGGAAAAAGFVLLGSLLTAACLLPTHATSLVAGYVFGGAFGAVLAWAVVLLAAMIAFSLCTSLVGARAVQVLAGSPKAVCVHRALLGQGFWRTVWLITLLRLSPALPFAATNLLMAAFGVRAVAFLCATVAGVTPRALAVAWIGAELSELDWRAGGNRWTTLLAIVATATAVFLVGRIARAALRREVLDDDDDDDRGDHS